MHGVPPASVTPSHEQVPYIYHDGPRHRLYSSEAACFLKTSTRVRLCGAGLRDLQAADLVLEEECQDAKIRVCGDAGLRAGKEVLPWQGGIVQQTQVEQRLYVEPAQRICGREPKRHGQRVEQLLREPFAIAEESLHEYPVSW